MQGWRITLFTCINLLPLSCAGALAARGRYACNTTCRRSAAVGKAVKVAWRYSVSDLESLMTATDAPAGEALSADLQQQQRAALEQLQREREACQADLQRSVL